MSFISPRSGYQLLVGFGAAMLVVTYLVARLRHWHTKEGFLVANREVGWLVGAASIASSWIWAPALFVSTQMAYQNGLAGIFWFTLPNILALAIFGWLAPKIREQLPNGYTFPQYIHERLHNENVHKVFLFPYFFYQLMAVVVQLYAGGSLLALLTGIPLATVMPILAGIVLIYTLISGLAASVVTDFVQLVLIYAIGVVLLPLVVTHGGGWPSVGLGLHGINQIRSILDPSVAFSFGIVTSIGLIAGSISDQQNWQRVFAIRKDQLVQSFVVGSFIFGLVPIGLSLLGFLAANPTLGIHLPAGIDVSLIGVQAVAQLLPHWALILFTIMLLGGLCSTLDAGLAATSSLWVTDVQASQSDNQAIRRGRWSMLGMTLLGLAVAYGFIFVPGFQLEQLWWVFNTIAACIVVPTILSLYWERLTARGVFWGVVTAFVFGIPAFVYGNIINNSSWIVGSSLFIIAVSTGFCWLFARRPSLALASVPVRE